MVDHPAETEAAEALQRPYNTADPAQVNAARKKGARLRWERLNVVSSLMDLKEGRAWMYGLLENCHVFSTSFVQGDQFATAFKEGERNHGLRLLADIMDAAPDRYVDMCKEGRER